MKVNFQASHYFRSRRIHIWASTGFHNTKGFPCPPHVLQPSQVPPVPYVTLILELMKSYSPSSRPPTFTTFCLLEKTLFTYLVISLMDHMFQISNVFFIYFFWSGGLGGLVVFLSASLLYLTWPRGSSTYQRSHRVKMHHWWKMSSYFFPCQDLSLSAEK